MSALTNRGARRIMDRLRAMPEAQDLNRAIRKTAQEWEILSGGPSPTANKRTSVVISAILEDITEDRATPAHLAALAVIREELMR